MTRRPAFALAAVLGALVIMSMVVAVGAQRALLAARQAALELARADLAVSVASAQAAVLDEPADSTRVAGIRVGVLMAGGVTAAGTARAAWRLMGAVSPYATVEIEAQAPMHAGVARALHRALVTPHVDSLGVARWMVAGGAGWVRVPLP